MADIKGGSFIKVVQNYQKHAGRARERLLQNFGKADKTRDENFDEYVSNFNKQQTAVLKLQKEMKTYQNCLKAMQAASKALMETICDLYEPSWTNFDHIQVKAQILDNQWEEFCSRLNDQVINPLSAYLVQFPEVGNKISKRGRKLLDYDGCRHHIQNLEQNSKKREEAKILKAKEQLEEARNLYELINTELHDELPALYDSRVSFFISNVQCLFLAETKFHTESSKLFSQLNDMLEALASENHKGSYSTKRIEYLSDPALNSSEEDVAEDSYFKSNGESSKVLTSDIDEKVTKETPPSQIHESLPTEPEDIEVKIENDSQADMATSAKTSEPVDSHTIAAIHGGETVVHSEVEDLPPGVLYKVKATYKYVAEDVDELSFESGELINVVAFDDPDEQEEGWLMGYRGDNPKRGLFPANFTRPI